MLGKNREIFPCQDFLQSKGASRLAPAAFGALIFPKRPATEYRPSSAFCNGIPTFAGIQ